MAVTVDPKLLREIKRYGAFDVSACFHCGNCTAVCPLSDGAGNFPRRMIRLGQIGDRSRLVGGPEPWLCYYCGECSDTCPREAEPGEYMAALRRYVTAAYEPTGVARWMYRTAFSLLLVTIGLGAVIAGLLVSLRAPEDARRWLFSLVPYETIHNVGVTVGVVAAISALAGVAQALRRFLAGSGRPSVGEVLKAIRLTVGELLTMRRHRDETARPGVAWYQTAAWVHIAIMWGFLGLLAATILDYLFIVVLPLNITTFWPARVIGTLGGVAMMLGVTAAIVRRLRRSEKSVAHSRPADWWLLAFLFLLGVTGFWLEVAVTIGASGPLHDVMLLVHAAMAMELVLLTTFTKMSHVIYRPLALFAYHLREKGDILLFRDRTPGRAGAPEAAEK